MAALLAGEEPGRRRPSGGSVGRRAILTAGRPGRRPDPGRVPGVRIKAVEPGSPAERAGLVRGDVVNLIDDQPITDFLDFYLASFGPSHRLAILRGNTYQSLTLKRGRAQDAGAEIETGPFRTCGNRCIFCFVDQIPKGLRPALYLKDEDYRLSFLHGNYVTLTNLRPDDERRITSEHLSPLYVSVHATREALRACLLGRKPGEPITSILKRLARSGIRFHTQVVVVPGHNDGKDLEATLRDLCALHQSVLSVSVVPVGLTRHRTGLALLRSVTPHLARKITGHVEWLNAAMRKKTGRGMVYASDEMVILSGTGVPPANYYDDFPQIENGVGMLRRLLDEMAHLRVPSALRGRRLHLVTGPLARPYIEILSEELGRRGVKADVSAVENALLGPTVTVSGLLPGRAVLDRLQQLPECDAVVLPPDVANADGLTLDDIHVCEIEADLGVPVVLADQTIAATLKKVSCRIAGS